MKSENDRIIEMIKVLKETARGYYDVQLELSDENNGMDALAMGINRMIDELKTNTVRLEYVDKRIEEISETIQRVASGDYSASSGLSRKNDIFDALGIGVNMMTDDIKIGIEEIETQNKKH